jgi:hypothetical protein
MPADGSPKQAIGGCYPRLFRHLAHRRQTFDLDQNLAAILDESIMFSWVSSRTGRSQPCGPRRGGKGRFMTTQTHSHESMIQPMIWLAVAFVAIIALAYFFVW